MNDTTGNDTLRLERLREIFDDDHEAIAEVLAECSTYVRRAIGELALAVEAGDVAGARAAAHAIKGSCANVGATACERAALAVESAARAGVLPGDIASLRTLVDAFDVAIATYTAASDTKG